MGMLRHATRRFKRGACLDQEQSIYGGILQGCPLSMIAMNCVVNIWLRSLSSVSGDVHRRAYVDDVSATWTGKDGDHLVTTGQKVLDLSLEFVGQMRGQVKHTKSFSFGSPLIRGRFTPAVDHKDEFRLVGGSIVYRDLHKLKASQLEVK